MVYGIKDGGEIKKGEGCDRPFNRIEEKIILYVKKGTFSGTMFSVS